MKLFSVHWPILFLDLKDWNYYYKVSLNDYYQVGEAQGLLIGEVEESQDRGYCKGENDMSWIEK